MAGDEVIAAALRPTNCGPEATILMTSAAGAGTPIRLRGDPRAALRPRRGRPDLAGRARCRDAARRGPDRGHRRAAAPARARRLRHQRRAPAGQEVEPGQPARAGRSARRASWLPTTGIEKVDIAGPGFLNITIAAAAQGQVAADIVAAGDGYGRSDAFAGEKINLEFVSANPTGPIHIGGVRWAAVGDSLGADPRRRPGAAGHPRVLLQRPRRADRPVRPLAARRAKGEPVPEDGYGGDYIAEIASAVLEKRPDALVAAPTTRRRRSSAPRASS